MSHIHTDSHFAKVLNGIVINVIAAEPEFFNTLVKPIESSNGQWIQTSYHTYGGKNPEGTPLRKNYGSIGFTYDSVRDAFFAPQPYESWTLDEETCLWHAPVAMPTDEKEYEWNEESTQWVVMD